MSTVTFDTDGFVVDAEVVGDAFGIEPEAVPEKMRSGRITSRCEKGVDEDEGRWRLTFFSGGRALRLIVDAKGTILSRSTFPAHPPRTGPLDLTDLPRSPGGSGSGG
ncbi:hypothetical protein SAMN04490244_105209 [Tranquillimonas rosea]|uniref:Uncharacterized protein n=1 Tax=Tranquillimonas rosea TaxID=641238 RepID=A0A1H9UDB8_9RHOB|nr:DUF6522 family protein [Tranquillimonas rosea]SES07436.1 hypothetical protein SAMN04490244_105209 [Tranquillimonas rosea]